MLPAPATMEPSELPMVERDGGGDRAGLEIDARQRLVAAIGYPEAPERGGQTGAGTLADRNRRGDRIRLGFSLATLSFGLFEIQTSSSTAIQSGEPGTGKTASGCRRSIGIFTPGVLTPGLGAGGVCRSAEPSRKP